MTVEEIRSSISAALELRRRALWHGAKLAGFMSGCGTLVVGTGYVAQYPVSPWAFVLPVALAALIAPGSLKEVRRLSQELRELQAAARRFGAEA